MEKADFQHISEEEETPDDVIIDSATQDQVRQMTSSIGLPEVIDENDSAEDMVEEEGVKSDEQKENIKKDVRTVGRSNNFNNDKAKTNSNESLQWKEGSYDLNMML